jgi:hypothetical protein
MLLIVSLGGAGYLGRDIVRSGSIRLARIAEIGDRDGEFQAGG